MNILPGKKTYIVAVVGLITVIGSFMTGDFTLQESLVRALELLGLATLRLGVASK
jgi:hypothetical protein